MSYHFRCVFSGPCAYVPNKLKGDSTPPDQVQSWSVILPNLQMPVVLTSADPPIPPHYAVLQYPTELFVTDFEPDLVFRRSPQAPEFGLVLLRGARIRFRSAEFRLLKPDLGTLTNLEPPPPIPPDSQLQSLLWLPQPGRLLAGAGTIGNPSEAMFRPGSGLPFGGNVAGHVLCTAGTLSTNSLLHDENLGGAAPSIWGFRASETAPPPVASQAVAHSVALDLDGLTTPIAIELTSVANTRRLWLKSMPASGPVRIEIKNREFDEIVGFADSTISLGAIDRDFKILYKLSANHTQPCPLPFLVRDEGVGTRRTTCSGGLFYDFDSALFSATLAQWAALP